MISQYSPTSWQTQLPADSKESLRELGLALDTTGVLGHSGKRVEFAGNIAENMGGGNC
jgi:hypothetical protein